MLEFENSATSWPSLPSYGSCGPFHPSGLGRTGGVDFTTSLQNANTTPLALDALSPLCGSNECNFQVTWTPKFVGCPFNNTSNIKGARHATSTHFNFCLLPFGEISTHPEASSKSSLTAWRNISGKAINHFMMFSSPFLPRAKCLAVHPDSWAWTTAVGHGFSSASLVGAALIGTFIVWIFSKAFVPAAVNFTRSLVLDTVDLSRCSDISAKTVPMGSMTATRWAQQVHQKGSPASSLQFSIE